MPGGSPAAGAFENPLMNHRWERLRALLGLDRPVHGEPYSLQGVETMDRRVGSVRSTGIRSTVLLSLGLAIASMGGCGGQGSSAPANNGAGKSLISVAVSPSNSFLSVGAVQQFSATATFKDGTTQNVTGSAAWGSSDATKATIQRTGQAKRGLATAVAEGTVAV